MSAIAEFRALPILLGAAAVLYAVGVVPMTFVVGLLTWAVGLVCWHLGRTRQ